MLPRDADALSAFRSPAGEAARRAPRLTALAAVPVCLAISGGTALAQTATPSCTSDSGGYDCTIAAGNYTQPLQKSVTGSSSSFLRMDDSGTFNIQASTAGNYGLNFFTHGNNGYSSDSGNASMGDAGAWLGAYLLSPGAVTFTGSSALTVWQYAVLAQSIGGDGGSYTDSNHKYNGANGASAVGGTAISNSQAISVRGSFPQGVMALEAEGLGGNGGYGASGGSGGWGGDVQIQNMVPVSIGTATSPANGSGGAIGIAAISQGGNPGNSEKNDESTGGAGGPASVSDTAPVGVYWVWQGSGPTAGSQLYGILAQSAGAANTYLSAEGKAGGRGGDGQNATISLTAGASVSVVGQNSVTPAVTSSGYELRPALTGAGVAALSLGAVGGPTSGDDDNATAGAGGAGGVSGSPTYVNIYAAQVSVQGNGMAGVEAQALAGAGGSGNYPYQTTGGWDAHGGNGGTAYDAQIILSSTSPVASVSTAGSVSPGLLAVSAGGDGGAGGTYTGTFGHDAGDGGNAGAAGNASVTVSGSRVSTSGDQSGGIVAISQGGAGGAGGDRKSGNSGDAGGGGSAGAGGNATVDVQYGSSVTTNGSYAPGVVAVSLGGAGGNGGSSEVNMTGSPRPGGNGGASGVATATLESGATISTSGANSPGLVAVSGGGNGGTGNSNSNIGNSQGGDGGAGGNGGRSVNGVLTAAVASNAGSIVTLGDNSPGMVAQGASGAGGAGGNVNGIAGESGDAGPAGTVGSVSAANNAGGSISTSGTASVGMLAQSLGGNGGDGGTINYTNIAFGGSGSTAANAGLVSVSNAGSISTTGVSAMGILAQSIGGGGGDTAGADELVVVGGDAAGGGAGGTVGVSAGGRVSTAGDLAPAILAQSIGGGGGTAGDVTGVAPGGSLAIGGDGGGGGAGGAASITGSGLAVGTAGSNALGIAAESAGGGGGNGGAAYSMSVSAGLGAAVAIGGSGGNGGAGGAVAVNLAQTSILTASGVQDATDPASQPYGTVLAPLAVDSYGIVAQSVGGGGGVGGSSLAKAFVQDVPIPDTSASVAVSGTYSAGGTGGGGGAGGSVAVNLTSGVSVLTYGAGAHGLVAESIGGGGGAGGDSSATSSTFGFKTLSTLSSQKNYNLDVSVSLGGTGGNGGAGGPVSVTLGGSNGVADAAATTAPVQLTTLGDYADAVFAQSVGGGGGNAGFGAGSTQNGTSSGTALKLNVTLGATGGGGGAGGAVNVYMFPGAVIQTYGDSSNGIAAQSVGGGGGNSSGGSIQVGLPSANTVLGVVNKSIPGVGGLSSSVTLKLGQTGGSGGNGGAVNVQVSGASVTTGGQDAAGIFAQSVGDGGGTGGSAGSTGSSDDPTVIQDVIAGKKFANSLVELINAYFQAIKDGGGWKSGAGAAVQKLLPSLNFALSLGGTGGSGGDGGAVSVNLANSVVSTSGDYSDAVKLQSVGGGGGAAGSAVAGGSSGLGAMMKLNANVALGASGGSGGNGGQVSATVSQATLSTQGYAAYGLFAQSVGQGGGTAGSAQANSGGYFTLGATGTVGGGSSGGNGGAVSVQVQTPDGKLPALTPTTISTAGQYAHGVFLQSIGGGGGTAGDGYTLGGSIPIYDIQLSFGAGGSGTAGAGGAVSLDATGGALNISTAGASAYGVLAQSIGGGGGVTFTQPGMDDSDKYTYRVGGAGSNASGGNVSVILGSARITTTGDGSHAVFAQSVGGGGGIVGFAPGTTLLYEATASDGSGSKTSGNGGTVTVDTTGAVINTSGASAYGVFAQSVGAGGGVKSNNAGTAEIAGTTGAAGSSGSGGLVTVTAGGPIFASGANAVGIFAQSVGQTPNGIGSSGGVNITVTNNLQGGSGNGWAIWIDTDNTTNHVTISAPAYVHSLANLAIDTTGYGITTVDSWGKVSGTVDLTDNNATAGTFNNYYGATLVPAGTLSANVMNAGLIAPSLANNYATVPLVGTFTQTASGVYAPNVQFATRQADVLAVSGNATLAGAVRPVTQSVLPRVSVPILTVAGTATGTLTALPSPLFGYTITTEDVPASSDPIYLITNSSANFEPAGAGFSRLQSSVARHLLSVWNAGGNAAFGTFFAQLDTLAGQNMGSYANLLADLAPQAVADLAARALPNLQGFADNLDRCRRADGATRIGQDGRCAWFQFSGGVTSQSSGEGAAGFGLDQVTWAIGGETRVAPDLYLNGALAYQSSWLKTDGGAQKGSGQTGYAGAGLRYELGAWSFSGGVFGSVGSYSTTRYVGVPGQQSVIDGSPSINSVGGRLGVAYTFGFGSAFIRPRLTLDGIHVGAPGYTESGTSVDVLNVRDSSQSTFAATPSIEFGRQVALRPDLALRLSLTTGVSLLSNSTWSQYARFAAAPAGASDFATVVPMDSVAARVGLGLQLVKSGRYSLRAEYDGAFSEHANVNGGSIAFHAAF